LPLRSTCAETWRGADNSRCTWEPFPESSGARRVRRTQVVTQHTALRPEKKKAEGVFFFGPQARTASSVACSGAKARWAGRWARRAGTTRRRAKSGSGDFCFVCARRAHDAAEAPRSVRSHQRAPNLRWAVSAPAPRPLACARPVLASPRRDLCPRSKAAMCACPHPPRRFALDSTEGQKVKGVRVRVCRQRQRRPRGRSRGRYRHTRGAGCPSAAARGTCARCCPLFLPWRCPRASLHAQQEAAPCACCPARKCGPHALAILVLGAAHCLAPGRR